MRRSVRSRFLTRQRGVTLTELMIALVLGALVVLAATAMVVTSRGTYRTQDETTRIAESARFALELTNRLVRLAGYTKFGDRFGVPASYAESAGWKLSPDSYAFNGPNVVGTNNSRPGGLAGINGSDSLTIRFFGSSNPNATVGDGNVLDCAGFPVPEPLNISSLDEDAINRARSYNVLFVEPDVDGEPALKCARQTYDAATGVPTGSISDTQTLIRGVEDFQVLYGEIMAPPLPAEQDLDLNTTPSNWSIVYRPGLGMSGAVVDWNNVRSVRIAMLLRSAIGGRPDPEPATVVYSLFGTNYPASSDLGARFSLSTLSVAERTRVRRIVETTVFIRNRVKEWPSLQPAP